MLSPQRKWPTTEDVSGHRAGVYSSSAGGEPPDEQVFEGG